MTKRHLSLKEMVMYSGTEMHLTRERYEHCHKYRDEYNKKKN
jgi:hypothetical protein